MPFGDGTGPAGMGPMTGRAAGFCAGYLVPGSMNIHGYGLGAGGWFPYRGYGISPFYGARGYYPAYPVRWWGNRYPIGRRLGRGHGWGGRRGGW